MSTIQRITTAEELWEHSNELGFCELVRGELLLMSPANADHGHLESTIIVLMGAYVRKHRLGKIFSGDTGFVIERNPDTVRSPDVAFVTQERCTQKSYPEFFPGAPDLAVEVISPGDRKTEVLSKAEMWLATGTHTVWLVDAKRQTVTIYERDVPPVACTMGDSLECPALLPGFKLPLSEIFE